MAAMTAELSTLLRSNAQLDAQNCALNAVARSRAEQISALQESGTCELKVLLSTPRLV